MSTVMKMVSIPWPIPLGWSYVYEDMHSIERTIGQYTLIVGEDDQLDANPWLWWLCPKGSPSSIAMGQCPDMFTAICEVLNALALRMGGHPSKRGGRE